MFHLCLTSWFCFCLFKKPQRLFIYLPAILYHSFQSVNIHLKTAIAVDWCICEIQNLTEFRQNFIFWFLRFVKKSPAKAGLCRSQKQIVTQLYFFNFLFSKSFEFFRLGETFQSAGESDGVDIIGGFERAENAITDYIRSETATGGGDFFAGGILAEQAGQ